MATQFFNVPSGDVGKAFVMELGKFFRAYADGAASESIALTAAMVMPGLLLQKPTPESRAKDHVASLSRRLEAWKSGQISILLHEGRTIQKYLPTHRKANGEALAQSFTKLMFSGRVKAALRLLSDDQGARVLGLDAQVENGKTVREILVEKHPPGKEPNPDILLTNSDSDCPAIHPVYFERLTSDLVHRAALQTEGAAGPSGLDATAWRRLCTSFGSASTALCDSLSLLAKRICTKFVDPAALHAFIACRLTPLDKMPGVRPIGVCEVARRIIGKAIMWVVKEEVQLAAGPLQLCAGQPGGIEAAIHAVHKLYEDPNTEAVLMVDARNAFNELNRKAALINIQRICPALSPALTNFYRQHAKLFVAGETILSEEGTTQGDPLAMGMYALAVLPMIDQLQSQSKQIWFADDATGSGLVDNVYKWWDTLNSVGPDYGYFPQPAKTWLLVKDNKVDRAKQLFSSTGVNITTEGRKVLGAALGTQSFVNEYLDKKVRTWTEEVITLAHIASTQPHAAYAALTHGLVGRWIFAARCVDGIARYLEPLEQVIRHKLIPALTGRSAPGDEERDLLALPVRLGGLGIVNPVQALANEFRRSSTITKSLIDLICEQQLTLGNACNTVISERQTAANSKRRASKMHADQLRISMSEEGQRALEVAQDCGASHWLSALPYEAHGFVLHKSAFRDALCLRYGWRPQNLPTKCVCGQDFGINHALCCPTGGFPSIRHNEIRDITASLLAEVCHDVSTEPHLQPLTGEALTMRTANSGTEARLDICASGLWDNRFSRTFFDVRVFHPFVRTNRYSNLSGAYARHEKEKRRQYEQRVREVEMSTFTPLVFSTAGGMGRAATATMQRLASLLAEKWKMPYPVTINWLRCRFTFALLRAAIMCLRGTRSRRHQPAAMPLLAAHESRLPLT